MEGDITEEIIHEHPHYKRPLSEEEGIASILIVVGKSATSALLEKAIPLTEGWTGKTFRLNEFGKKYVSAIPLH